jgi:hypothetical protein
MAFSFVNTNVTTVTGTGIVFHLQSARVSQASDISTLPYVNDLVPGAIAWVDNDGNGHWEAVEKQSPFTTDSVIAPGAAATAQYGVSIAQSEINYSALVGSPGANSGTGTVFTYFKGILTSYQFNNTLALDVPDTSGFGNMVTFGNSKWAVAGANTSNSGMGYAAVLYRDPAVNAITITQILVPPDQDFSTIGFGTSGTISKDERWMYIGAPGANKVYAYEIVEVTKQVIEYTTTVGVSTYNYSDTITINDAYPDQLLVILNGNELVAGTDFTIDANNVILTSALYTEQPLVISRRLSAVVDAQTYYNIQQDSTSGAGYSALFNVTNIRGTYNVELLSGGTNYLVGNTLIINGTQLGGTSPANDLTITVGGITT